MPLTRVVVITVALLGSFGVPAAAQRSRPADEWPPAATIGQSVSVVIDQGITVKVSGKLLELSNMGLRLRQGMDIRTIAIDDILRIETPDPLWNGTVKGAIIGAAALGIGYAVLAASICPDCYGGGSDVEDSLEWAALGAGLGAAAGLSIDALVDRQRTVYVAPILSQGTPSSRAVGAMIRVSW